MVRDEGKRGPSRRRPGVAEVRALAGQGLGAAEIARRLGIGEADVWRLLQAGDCMGRAPEDE